MQLISCLFLSNRESNSPSFFASILAVLYRWKVLERNQGFPAIPACNWANTYPLQVKSTALFWSFWAEDIDSLWNPCQCLFKTRDRFGNTFAIRKKKGIPLLNSLGPKILIILLMTFLSRVSCYCLCCSLVFWGYVCVFINLPDNWKWLDLKDK